jgi:hypothetical protein
MSNLQPGTWPSDVDATVADDIPAWEEPGEIVMRLGDFVWIREGNAKPVLVQITAVQRCWQGYKLAAQDVERGAPTSTQVEKQEVGEVA